jgi:uncharacterized membrane-anchored protein
MRIMIIIAAIVFQVGVLAYMGGEREYVLRTGKTVYLRTAPIDPQDAFRGDYVRLNYEISIVSAEYMRDGLKCCAKQGDRIYAVLDIDENQSGYLQYVTDKRPGKESFIRGRVGRRWGWMGEVPILYGIEAYFVEQGKGRQIEQFRGMRGDIQVPLEMETALGSSGIAVLKGYRIGKLGIGLEIRTDPNDRIHRSLNFMTGPAAMRVVGAKIKLKNMSNTPLAVVDLPEGRSFTLEPDLRWVERDSSVWRWVNENAPRKAVDNSDVRVLQPGDVYEFAIDFHKPAWFVEKAGESPRAITDPNLGWGSSFRLVYRPPSKDECKNLDKADLIWHGYLRSSSFNGGRKID